MTRTIKLKNCQDVADTYSGQEIAAGTYYQLEETEFVRFANDPKVQNHLSSDPAKLIVNNGTDDLAYLAGKSHLEGCSPTDSNGIPLMVTPNVDPAGRPEFRRIVTKPTWLYQPKSLDFWTSKLKSLYNRKHNGGGYYDGDDPGDAWMRFFDSSDTELTQGAQESDEDFQTRLTANCVKTHLVWETKKSYDVQGALLYITHTPTNPAWLWCIAAPDIAEVYGGSVPFMGRGMNLKMMAPLHPHIYDAVSASTIVYDSVNHSGRIAIVVKHGTGEQIGIQFIVVGYEEP